MSLRAYRAKRALKTSGEPAGKGKSSLSGFHFVVQKHAARQLHYDFRLEHRGVLLSWAIPKGPSLNPDDKRLAVHVEDHPLEYQYFHGVIPPGHYGAGTVEIWDHGIYTTVGAKTKGEIDAQIQEGLERGHLHIVLEGEKLKGEFILQKIKEKNWILFKRADSYAVSKKKAKIAEFVSPMLATLIRKPFTDPDWLFEIKWDGFRALSFIDHGHVVLKSRNKKNLNAQFPSIVQQLKKAEGQAILDGELVVLDAEGRSHFQLIQNYKKTSGAALYYYVFDILYRDGEDLRHLPLYERKKRLQAFLGELSQPNIRLSDYVEKEGEKLFSLASKKNLEGIIGKKLSSPYESRRSPNWVKMKTTLRQEVLIAGFTAPRGSRKKFGALIVGVQDEKGALRYAGRVGSGFTETSLQNLSEKLEPLIQSRSPFKMSPQGVSSVTWVKPKLVCEVAFTEWTKEGSMRHPVFQGLQESIKNTPSLSNLDKIFWPNEGYTKGDLLHYYKTVAPWILPYLKNRPIVLYRFPDGIEGEGFYQKDMSASHPAWIKTFPLEQEGKTIQYLLIPNLRSLLYAIQLASIDLHPFLSSVAHLESPDFCVIDLDPHGIDFAKVIEVARAFHTLLEQLQLPHYCKTSGGKGLHILIPLRGNYSYEQSKQFAQLVGSFIHTQFPKITSLERNPKKRLKRIYIDCLQNAPGQTIVAPYAVRPRPHALVSTPLLWEEVKAGLTPGQFSIKTLPARLKKMGDVLKPILRQRADLKQALRKFEKMAKTELIANFR